mgnify:FL=1|tara:strand:+ start:133 stop:306 length:174 start_codon:yes stop_codon:yes gene_type:complete
MIEQVILLYFYLALFCVIGLLAGLIIWLVALWESDREFVITWLSGITISITIAILII